LLDARRGWVKNSTRYCLPPPNHANGIGDSELESCPLGLRASLKTIENKGAAKKPAR
jgi:hypothetical protein